MTSSERVVYNMYIYNRTGRCLMYREWCRPRNTLKHAPEEDTKLMFGLILTLKHTCLTLSPDETNEVGLRGYCTENYRLHHYESPTGIHFVMLTSPALYNPKQSYMEAIYKSAYLRYVVRNPCYKLGTEITCPAFLSTLDDFASSLTG